MKSILYHTLSNHSDAIKIDVKYGVLFDVTQDVINVFVHASCVLLCKTSEYNLQQTSLCKQLGIRRLVRFQVVCHSANMSSKF